LPFAHAGTAEANNENIVPARFDCCVSTILPAFDCCRLQEANDDGVVIATYDCTTNEEPSDPKLSVNGYPTTYFLSASGEGG